MTEREFCIAVNMISGVGFLRYSSLLDTFGSPDEVRKAERGVLQKVDGIGPVLAERIISFDWDAELSREFAVAERGGVQIITLVDEDYPDELRNIYDPPLCLYVRGKLPEKHDRSIAIVGSRRISRYGEKMAVMLAEEAVACGFTVYSGLALGVDTLAHKAVVDMAGCTVGVLGGGLMHMYPKENIPLARDMIRNGGAVISEFPLNFPVNRHNFPRRNRIVAAMCRAVIVVEAGLDSGALITAKLAAEMGKEVFALPGRVDNVQAKGCHKLIKEGACLIENFDDVMLVLATGLRPGMENMTTGEIVGSEQMSPDCEKVCTLLSGGDMDLEELQMATAWEPGMLMAVLMKLELLLAVERDSFGYYHLTGSRKKEPCAETPELDMDCQS
ncbi:MAG: DNA-processing protein DprA [Lentisphaeria bacterium]|nr:DNA-processing protein DprA [Lentisphaeria bacterium]